MVRLIEVLGGVIENRHTGIKTMIDEMKEAKLPEPVFKNEREDFTVTFYNGEYPELYPEELKSAQEKEESAQENKHARNISKELILEFCSETKSLKEIMEHLGYKNQGHFRDKYINPLLDEGKLKMTIPEQPKNRNQKYISSK